MIKIVVLYPKIMNIYGCYGNVIQIEKYLLSQGHSVEIKHIEIDDELDVTNADIIFIGSNNYMNLEAVLNILKRYKESFIDYINQGGVILATGLSSTLFGEKIKLLEKEINGLGIYNYNSELLSKSKITLQKFISKYDGFVRYYLGSNIDELYLRHNYEYLGTYNKKGKTIDEGIVIDNIILTTFVGPLLIRNPEIAITLTNKILEQRGLKKITQTLSNDYNSKKIRRELFRQIKNKKEKHL